MNVNRSPLPIPTVLVALTLTLLASCGSDTPEPPLTVASIESAAATTVADDAPADSVDAPEDPEEAFEAFDACLRDEGFDLGIGNTTSSDIAVADGSGPMITMPAGFDPEAFEAASQKCEAHLANIITEFDEMSPEELAAIADAEAEFINCAAEHGFDLPAMEQVTGPGMAVASSGDGTFPDVDAKEFETMLKECSSAFADVADGDD